MRSVCGSPVTDGGIGDGGVPGGVSGITLFPEQLRERLFGVAHGARERDLGEVVLEDRRDVVVVGLDDGLFRLNDLDGVGYTGDEAVAGLSPWRRSD